jgi:hypothetical protein
MLQVIMLVVGVWYVYELLTLGSSGLKLGLPPEVLVEWRAQRRKQYLWGIAAGWGSLVAGILTSVGMTPSYPTTTDVARAQLAMIVVTAIVLIVCLALSIAASRKAKSLEQQRTGFGYGMPGYPPTAGQPGADPAAAQSGWYPPAVQAPAPATPIAEPLARAGAVPTAEPASPGPAPDHNLIQLGTFVAAGSSLVLLAVLFIPWFTWIEGGIVITPTGGTPYSPSGDWSGMAALGFPCLLLVAASLAGLGAAAARLTRAFKLPAATDIVLLALGVLAVGLVVVALVAPVHPAPGNRYVAYPDATVNPAVGLYLGLAAAMGIVLGASLGVAPFGRQQRTTAAGSGPVTAPAHSATLPQSAAPAPAVAPPAQAATHLVPGNGVAVRPMTEHLDAPLGFCEFCGAKRIMAGQGHCAQCGRKLSQPSEIQESHSEVANETKEDSQVTASQQPTAAKIRESMKILSDAYLCRDNPELYRQIEAVLASVLTAGESGVGVLLSSLYEGISISNGSVLLKDWGDYTWNELLKKREIVRALQRGNAKSASSSLKDLLAANCRVGLWAEIIVPALRSAIEAIDTSAGQDEGAPQAEQINGNNAPAPAVAALAWAPTHLVPAAGMAFWAAPDGRLAPVGQVPGNLELVVDASAGAWAQVRAANGWQGWVDGRLLAGGVGNAGAKSVGASAGKEERCEAKFNANGRVVSIDVPEGRWALKVKGQNKYYEQRASSLLEAAEILRKVDAIPQLTYYTVTTPDGSLGRDSQGYYTEAPIKTTNLIVGSRGDRSRVVEFSSLRGFGDTLKNQTSVALMKKNGQYSRLVLLMKCGKCDYESPVETQAGSLVRECYCCGTENTGHRGEVSVLVGTGMVEI